MEIEVELINALPCIHPSIIALSGSHSDSTPPGVYYYMVCANQSKMWEEWMLDVQAKAMTGLDWTGLDWTGLDQWVRGMTMLLCRFACFCLFVCFGF
jgi:hypothetical protein